MHSEELQVGKDINWLILIIVWYFSATSGLEVRSAEFACG